jgi:hypothetical protein
MRCVIDKSFDRWKERDTLLQKRLREPSEAMKRIEREQCKREIRKATK